jgi:hypothetical protein
MTFLRYVVLTGLAFLWQPRLVVAEAHNDDRSALGIQQHVLLLDFKNNGQHVTALVGERIEITLRTIGPQQYGAPRISSAAVRLEGTTLKMPPNPGGPTFVYVFEAAAEGEASIRVPIVAGIDPDVAKRLTFTVTIQVVRG